MAEPEAEQAGWRELYARDDEKIHLLWNEQAGQFRVKVQHEDHVDQTPPLTSFEAARDCYDHPCASETLGQFVMKNHAEHIAPLEEVPTLTP